VHQASRTNSQACIGRAMGVNVDEGGTVDGGVLKTAGRKEKNSEGG
jgi:hypothetical protein